ncbi:baseplate J/gp47 family protein [Clostridium oceanicum]|uniref:Baseplate J/gp47 family protein n=1 Tax=Clostridium oceanicum TaxID=1543 RepID=A0ABN1JCC5_9CLOT
MSIEDFIPDYLKEDADTIHERMLEKAPSGVSTIEGDFFWDITRPVAEEIGEYTQLKLIHDIQLPFVKYSYGQYLQSKGEEEGVFIKPAVKASGNVQIKGTNGTIIKKGKIVGTTATEEVESIEFEVVESNEIDESGVVDVKVQCLKAGTIGNVCKGSINVLMSPIAGIKSIINLEDFTSGIDIEKDVDLKQRILEKKQKPITSGNKYHYDKWAKEIEGVGDSKVFPLWKGPGTVKVVIVNSNKRSPDKNLIEKVFKHIEENRPIGTTVTVTGAVEKDIKVNAKILLASGFNIGGIQAEFIKLLDNYLKTISFKTTYISIARVGSLLLSTPGVLDYTELKINNSTANIGLENEEIPVLGTIELGV